MKASVIIPTYNRSGQLFRTLKSLVEIDFDKSVFEIIVVDNGSTDTTKQVVQEYINSFPEFLIKYIYDDMPGLLTGRHRGLKESKSEILVFIDDDVHVAQGWLTAICESFERHPEVHLIGGKCLPLYEKEPPRWLNYFWSDVPGGRMLVDLSLCDFGEEERIVSPAWIWGLNFSIRKKTLLDCGGFHPDSIPPALQQYQGDGETGLSMNILKKGYKALYNPDILVHHEVPAERMTLAYFDKRNFYQGVCNSYTEIRLNKGLFDSKINYIFTKMLKPAAGKIIRSLVSKSKLITKDGMSKQEEMEKQLLTLRFNVMQKAGYNFHRSSVKKSPDLLKWVLKENYFDYRLPENK